MKVKVIYVANDGKEFENEDDCRKYESRDVFAFDDYGKQIDVLDDQALMEESIYLIFKSKEALDYYNKLSDESGCCRIDEKTFNKFPLYVYYDCNGEWKYIKDRAEELKNEISKLEKYMNM